MLQGDYIGAVSLERRSRAAAVVRDFPRVKKFLIALVAAGVGANVVFTLLTTDRQAWDALGHITPGYVVLALGLAVMPWLAEAARITIWARFFGRRFSYGDALRCVWAGQVGAALAPIAVGNAAAKTAMMIDRGLTTGEAATVESLSVIEDFLFFVVALPLAAVATGAWRHPVVTTAGAALRIRFASPWIVAAFIAVLIAAGVVIALLTRRRGRWLGLRENFKLVGRVGKGRIALTVLIAAVHWGCRYSVVAALALSLGVHENPVRLFFLQWFVFTIMSFVPLPGAAVGAESAFYLVYNGILPAWSLSVMTAAWRMFSFYVLVMIAAVILVVLPHPTAPQTPVAAAPGPREPGAPAGP